jgi:tetratricopeptide (TPR) repeat protein
MLAWWLMAAMLAAQLQPQRPPSPPPEPEEEELGAEPEYVFNPLQAKREMEVGAFYAKKGSWKAAAGRFERATKWQPDLAEAYYRLGEAREKLQHWAAAVEAYRRYLELPGSEKKTGEIRKKIARIEAKIPKADAPRP